MLLKIDRYACELQFNIEEILVIKEGIGHKQYENERLMNDNLLDAAMRSDTPAATVALKGKADPNAPKDMYGLTPLHYSSHHGNLQMVDSLLSSSANAFSKDKEGILPIYRTLLRGYTSVAESLLRAMESSGEAKTWMVQEEKGGDLTAAAIERSPDGRTVHSAECVRRVAKLEAKCLQSQKSLLH